MNKDILKNKKYAKPIIAILIIIVIIVIYRDKHRNKEIISNNVLIEAAEAKISNLPIYLSALGTVTANNVVNIKTQINGKLIKLGFEDGQKVKKGDLLAQIDPKPYQAQLSQYQGQLLRDQAILENSLLDLKRYKELWKQNSVSKQILDTQIALVKQNEGIVQLDQGLVDNAKVNLDYCAITAAFDGQVGISNVGEGTLVQSSDSTAIVTLTSLDPILVMFSIPEIELPAVIKASNKETLSVKAYDQSFKNLLNSGELTAIDNQIDTTTGTIKLKASFKNTDYSLFPNQFVNIKLLVKTLEDVIVLPSTAIQYGPNGSFVYLVNEDKTQVTVQPVVTDATSGSYTTVTRGISEHQMVAITGVDKLRDGVSVTVTSNGF